MEEQTARIVDALQEREMNARIVDAIKESEESQKTIGE